MTSQTAAIPRHIAIIPDGNRRWAKEHHLSPLQGHKRGVEVFENVGITAIERGVKYLTFWGFSSDNWKRPKPEVRYLMQLIRWVFNEKINDLHKRNIRLNFIGRLDEFTRDLQKVIEKAKAKTAQNTRGIMTIALNYGGREEIVDMIRKAITLRLQPDQVTTTNAQQLLYAPDMPNVDLIVRTSGEERLSGYLPWEGVYSELYFSKKYWPDFTPRDLDDALAEYCRRQRRFGK